jgi:hypothetical protein
VKLEDFNSLFWPSSRAPFSLKVLVLDNRVSLAAHARGVNLCFLQRGPELPDPILRGSGKVVRTVALTHPTISSGPTSAL